MAPAGGFPTFETRTAYRITEGLEALFAVILVSILLLIVGICYFIYQLKTYKEKRTIRSVLQECNSVFQDILSAVFNILEIAKEETTERDSGRETGNKILLFGKGRPPESLCCYVSVLFYFIILLVLLFLLFVCMFFNSLLYRKTSTCNDINVKTEYSICFDTNRGYERVDCMKEEIQKDENLEVICYLTDFGFFRALGTSFGAIQAVRALLSLFFPIGIKVGRKSPCLIMFLQIVGVIVSIGIPIALYCVVYVQGDYILLYGNPPLVHATVWVACTTGVFFCLVYPWWAFHQCCGFKHDSPFKQMIRKDERRNYVLEWKYAETDTGQAPDTSQQPCGKGFFMCLKKCVWYDE